MASSRLNSFSVGPPDKHSQQASVTSLLCGDVDPLCIVYLALTTVSYKLICCTHFQSLSFLSSFLYFLWTHYVSGIMTCSDKAERKIELVPKE